MDRASGATHIMAERLRQMLLEGWVPSHDDNWIDGQLVQAAGCYLNHAALGSLAFLRPEIYTAGPPPADWPWAAEWWKPTRPYIDLMKAGALIAAEMDRLRRCHIDTAEGVVISPQIYEAMTSELADMLALAVVGEPGDEAGEALARIYSAADGILTGEENPPEAAQDIQRMCARGLGRYRFEWTHKPFGGLSEKAASDDEAN